MNKHANGFWHVEKIIDGVVGVMAADSTIMAVVPSGKNEHVAQMAVAHLFAATPQLLEVCCRISSLLENNFIVTPEGLKIDCTDLKKSLLDGLSRALRYGKTWDETHPHNSHDTETVSTGALADSSQNFIRWNANNQANSNFH
jgi:hypothetical protein